MNSHDNSGQVGRTVDEVNMRKVSIQLSRGEGLDIGSPIDFTYKLPFKFTGKIEKVDIELKPEGATKAMAAE